MLLHVYGVQNLEVKQWLFAFDVITNAAEFDFEDRILILTV